MKCKKTMAINKHDFGIGEYFPEATISLPIQAPVLSRMRQVTQDSRSGRQSIKRSANPWRFCARNEFLAHADQRRKSIAERLCLACNSMRRSAILSPLISASTQVEVAVRTTWRSLGTDLKK